MFRRERMSKLIYLAGAISYPESIGKMKDCTEWRNDATEYFKSINMNVFNPVINYEINKTFSSSGVPSQNFHYLKQSDIILVNLEYIEHSPGTLFEIFLGKWMMQKPIISFGFSVSLLQPHIKSSIDMTFNTLEESLEYICSMYAQ
jgi:nucleoside 2-deoxyribosyltransferase